MRKKLIAANWKMNKNIMETKKFMMEWLKLAPRVSVDVVICPPFTSIHVLQESKTDRTIKIGAQDLFWEPQGAYTGEISAAMLIDAGCEVVLIGHSERRQIMGETDDMVNKKVKCALQANLLPILCVGETLEQRKQGQTTEVISRQMQKALDGTDISAGTQLVIAYEPIWAIGTGMNASGDDAGQTIKDIRKKLKELYGEGIAQDIRILYGGSVNQENIAEFITKEDIDGALVGGASLDAGSFVHIVRAVENE